MTRLVALVLLLAAGQDAGERTPWTTSRLTGSPDPPPPFRSERAYPKLTFSRPVQLVPFPGGKRWVLVEEKGVLWTFRNDAAADKPDLFIDLNREIRNLDKIENFKRITHSLAMVFDPAFEKNRFCYVMYVLGGPKNTVWMPTGARVSRFRVTDADPPRIDPESELVVITWQEIPSGHNGCDLHFGNDGFLYISVGDAEAPSPPDRLRTGQDVSDLLSSILRIDVRRAEPGRPYEVPADNPFVGKEGIRPEVWAYGLRNPWRMSFDRATGRLWIGDVGWERWELIFCAEKGGENFGWSVMEGPDACLPDAKRGPTPIVPPAHAIPHPEMASVTGGFVYRGRRLKGFEGWYVYGDWESRKVYANPVRGSVLGERTVLARTPARIVSFAEEADGELLFLDHEVGGIHRLVPHDAAARNAEFPRTLSATGLFAATPRQTPAPGVIAYDVNAPRWADGATARRWVGIPGREAIHFVDKNANWPKESTWPRDSVLAKTLSLEGRKLETQVLHYDGLAWSGYTYVWNESQTDAALAPAEGAEVDLGGGRKWKVPARAACLSCHNPWPGYALTFNSAQLDRPLPGRGDALNQIRAFQDWGILPKQLVKARPLVDPYDERERLEARARSYLAVNCAHCHRFGGGASAQIDLRAEAPLEEMKMLGVKPTLGAFDLLDPAIVAGGDPSRSVLLFRTSKLGAGRMPHIGSDVVDERGVRLLAQWIDSLPPASADPGTAAARREDRSALERLRGGDAAGVDRLLASPTGALDLVGALQTLPEAARKEAVRRALDLPPGPVRDLFERFEPPDRRRQRLGPSIRPETILSRKGDADRGRKLYASAVVQCAKCHRVGSGPETVGPELTKIGSKYTRAQLLESILEPSKLVDPKYVGYVVRAKGDVFNGILVSKTDREVVLRDVEKELRFAAADVQGMVPQKNSLMPDGLLQHLTAEEAADLLAYLESLR
jgi:putative heme-binding domain-containing protein